MRAKCGLSSWTATDVPISYLQCETVCGECSLTALRKRPSRRAATWRSTLCGRVAEDWGRVDEASRVAIRVELDGQRIKRRRGYFTHDRYAETCARRQSAVIWHFF